MKIFKFLPLLLIMACSTHPSYKKYKNETVSVSTAIELAYAAYLKACVDRSLELGLQGQFTLCKEKAIKHVEDDIIFILEKE